MAAANLLPSGHVLDLGGQVLEAKADMLLTLSPRSPATIRNGRYMSLTTPSQPPPSPFVQPHHNLISTPSQPLAPPCITAPSHLLTSPP